MATRLADGDQKNRAISFLMQRGKVGRRRVIAVKNGETLDDDLEITENMKFKGGFLIHTRLTHQKF